ncbi:MAG: hypothetical protein CM15mP120_03880 [Pseudomonadota bacterium]|nr:MAG: hypothetical protein CM15mP120_03880 [Pseudomonadota bacterium]
MTEPLLFADLKVLDVGSWIAAPVATTILADYGAQVIKIEAPDLGTAIAVLQKCLDRQMHNPITPGIWTTAISGQSR